MTKAMRKVIKLLTITTLLFGVITPILISSPQVVEAKSSSGGHSSGGHVSSHTGSRGGVSRAGSNPATRGANPAARSNPATRSGANTASRSNSNPASRLGITNSNRSAVNPATRNAYNKAASSAYNGFHASRAYSNPSSYIYNPYRHSFYNYYLYSSLWNTSNSQVINNAGIDQNKLLHPKETTYWITINRGKKEPLKVLVTKSQYDKINVNDKLEVKNQKLYINGEVVPK